MAVAIVSRSIDDGDELREEMYEKAFARFIETPEWCTRVIAAAMDRDGRSRLQGAPLSFRLFG